jgi:hypothetical protein
MLHRPSAGAIIIGLSVLAAALLTNFGSELNLVVIHVAFPMLWGLTVALCWPKGICWRRVIGLVAVVVLYQVLGAVVYGVTVGWNYVMSDVVAQYLMLYSTAAQLLVSVIALICVNAMSERLRQNNAA